MEEVEYWEYVLVVYVLGINLLFLIMEGYFKRIWGKWGIDKVVSLKRGIFIVRFYIMENRNKVLEDEFFMFDKKNFLSYNHGALL